MAFSGKSEEENDKDGLVFWHLNVFINQRHFVVGLSLLMLFTMVCLWLQGKKRSTQIALASLFGVVIGFLPLFHKPVTLMFAVSMAVFFFLLPYLRLFLLLTGALAVSVMAGLWAASLSISGPAAESIGFYLGFTIPEGSDIFEVMGFFWYQFGLHCILAPIGLMLVPRRAKIIMLPAILSMLIAFTMRFSPDIMANHKFINSALIFMQMLSAYTVVRTFDFTMAYIKDFKRGIRV